LPSLYCGCDLNNAPLCATAASGKLVGASLHAIFSVCSSIYLTGLCYQQMRLQAGVVPVERAWSLESKKVFI
ncbi:hypothetical protein, partial [Pseudomonas sp.]|uniref:hypothetical protein n=1 Tax=Pseudomonas sp. TaxID=306 RepID=UPI003FD725F3